MHVHQLNAFFFRDFPNAHIPEILDEIYLKRVYEPFLAGRHDLTIVDVGANIGLVSYYFAPYARKVYALEPDTKHFEELTKMIEFNKIDNITPQKIALSNKNGTTTLYHNPNSTAHNLVLGDRADSEEVETVTLGEFMKRNKLTHIDILKLDPEGEEGKIITSPDFAHYASEIDVVVGEWHAWTTMGQAQFATTFIDLGYTFRWTINTQATVYTAVRI